jgi:predicted  nucleic acid-binding Zn-ribbon protein
MKVIEEVIADLTKASDMKVISHEDIKECISALVDANNTVDEEIKETDEALVDAEKEHKDEMDDVEQEKRDLQKEKDEIENKLDEALEKSLPVVSILDEMKLIVVKRLFQNCSVEQLEEVETFAKSLFRHPAKYIEFIHEN